MSININPRVFGVAVLAIATSSWLASPSFAGGVQAADPLELSTSDEIELAVDGGADKITHGRLSSGRLSGGFGEW